MHRVASDDQAVAGARRITRRVQKMQASTGLVHGDSFDPFGKSAPLSLQPAAGELHQTADIKLDPVTGAPARRETRQVIVFVEATPILAQTGIVMKIEIDQL